MIKDKDDYYDVQDELTDRYGNMPKATENLLDIAYTKALLHTVGVSSVSLRSNNASVITFKPDKQTVAGEKLISVIQSYKGRLTFTNNPAAPYLTLARIEPAQKMAELKAFAEKLTEN